MTLSPSTSRNESKTDELDADAVVSYVLNVIKNRSKQWQGMNIKQRQRLQRLVLPEGITFDKNTSTYGTVVLSPVFVLNQGFSGSKSGLVAGAGIAPATSRL